MRHPSQLGGGLGGFPLRSNTHLALCRRALLHRASAACASKLQQQAVKVAWRLQVAGMRRVGKYDLLRVGKGLCRQSRRG